MAEYIAREALIAELMKGTIASDDLYGMGIMSGIDFAMKKIVNFPAADVGEVVHGEWKEVEFGLFFECTNCGKLTEYHLSDFCPKCGAKMDGERRSE